MIKILNAEPSRYSDEARRILCSIGELYEQELSRAELLARLSDFDVLIVRLGFQIDRPVLDAGRRLKAIVTATTGLDHIDVDYAESRGVTVLSLRGEVEFLRSIPATAEHTWALLLALMRRIPWAYQNTLSGAWDREAFRGHDLKGKTLGIVGLGRIGEQVARYGQAFGMRVCAYDPYRATIPPEVTRLDALAALLSASDVISLHVPLNPATRGLLGPREFDAIKPGAVLVNTSRGAVIDEAALLRALLDGRLAGAALDVLCDENALPRSGDHPLIDYARTHDNLLITPHLGGATFESMAATEIFMANKLQHFLQKCATQ